MADVRLSGWDLEFLCAVEHGRVQWVRGESRWERTLPGHPPTDVTPVVRRLRHHGLVAPSSFGDLLRLTDAGRRALEEARTRG